MIPTSRPTVPPLENGVRLGRDEFERRYDATRGIYKAELIAGVVHILPYPAPVCGRCCADMTGWLGVYRAYTPGTESAIHASVRLESDTELQPECVLFIDPPCRGQVTISADDFVEGAIELAGVVSSDPNGFNTDARLDACRKAGVREYILWRVDEDALDWFIARNDTYERLSPDAEGVIRSETFPGLWLDVAALLRRDLATVLAVQQRGLTSPEHAAFVELLRQRRTGS